MLIKVKVFNPTNAALPKRATKASAARDIRANLDLVNPKFVFAGFIDMLDKSVETGIAGNIIGRSGDQSKKVLVLNPGGRALIPSGLKIEIPEGYSMDVRPRSGLALKYGIGILNSPGLIDQDYRGDVGVIVINLGTDPIVIVDGERIAQVKLQHDVDFEFDVVETEDELAITDRGAGGFNSTGTK